MIFFKAIRLKPEGIIRIRPDNPVTFGGGTKKQWKQQSQTLKVIRDKVEKGFFATCI